MCKTNYTHSIISRRPFSKAILQTFDILPTLKVPLKYIKQNQTKISTGLRQFEKCVSQYVSRNCHDLENLHCFVYNMCCNENSFITTVVAMTFLYFGCLILRVFNINMDLRNIIRAYIRSEV